MFDAVIFDFDGLILDTETPLFVAWQQTYHHFGVPPITLSEWSSSIGLHDDDPAMIDPLRRLIAKTEATEEEVQQVRRRFRNDLLDNRPVEPGVLALLDEAAALDLPVAIASSSPDDWIVRHLEPRGLLDRFPVRSCAGDGVPGKPDPAVYQAACERLGVRPEAALALEDSANGAEAAKAAGLTCVVVPNEVTRNLDLSHADLVVQSLEEVGLAAWPDRRD